ncbi:MAG TPA: DUF5615 family PIN-like protein [Gemmataceae bacterium]|nr:DUF5615 family PIN-like protein [Gemmataceae bacterium]
MVNGVLADNDVRSQVDYIAAVAQLEPWVEFWQDLNLPVLHFQDVGLLPTAKDSEVWDCCQASQLVLITGNRSLGGPDSLEATLRSRNRLDSLPVFTIGDVDQLNASRSYAEEVVETLIDYLQRIDSLLGTGRLYLP